MLKKIPSGSDNDESMMRLALVQAGKSAMRGEVPVGAVIVDQDGVVLAADGNSSIESCDPVGHAEILALRRACKRGGNYRLPPGTTMYVTLEPCAMCAAALVHARLARLVFGAEDPKAGGMVSCYRIGSDGKLNHRLVVEGGVLADESAALLKNFFRDRR